MFSNRVCKPVCCRDNTREHQFNPHGDVMISEDRKLRVEAKLKDKGIDVTLLWDTAKLKGSDYVVTVRCNKDGYEQERYVSTINKGSFQCQGCLNIKYIEVLTRFNFTFLQLLKGKDCSFVEFSCNECGGKRVLSVGNILNMKSIRCHDCRIIKVKQILESKGCTFVDRLFDNYHAKNMSQCRVVYRDKLGVERSVLEANLLLYRFASTESHWEQIHHIYVFKSKDTLFPYIKIGTANIPEKRLTDLKLNFDCDIYSFCFDSRYLANKVESACHKMFSEYRLDKEIAKEFTNGLSKRLKDGARLKTGFTEWFHSSIYEDVVLYIESNYNKAE